MCNIVAAGVLNSVAINLKMAMGEGFEPPKDLTPCWFSRPVHSAALPAHRRKAGEL